MSYSYKTQKYLKTKTLNEILDDFGLPLSISLGKQINNLGENYYSNWKEKVFVHCGTNRSAKLSWKILFSLCHKKKLKDFTEAYKEDLLHVSVIEDKIDMLNLSVATKRSVADIFNNDVKFLAEKFFECIDPNKFTTTKLERTSINHRANI
jgi:DNA-binding ferritin-like protein (Dps family)